MNGVQEVAGSNPVGPTIENQSAWTEADASSRPKPLASSKPTGPMSTAPACNFI
jgi:hypothetical protein